MSDEERRRLVRMLIEMCALLAVLILDLVFIALSGIDPLAWVGEASLVGLVLVRTLVLLTEVIGVSQGGE